MALLYFIQSYESILILVIFIFNLDFKNGRWPTLLHFAADHGLILSAVELLILPFSIDAYAVFYTVGGGRGEGGL
jgi:hypothetical protein